MWLTEEGRKVKFICQLALVPIISQALESLWFWNHEIMLMFSLLNRMWNNVTFPSVYILNPISVQWGLCKPAWFQIYNVTKIGLELLFKILFEIFIRVYIVFALYLSSTSHIFPLQSYDHSHIFIVILFLIKRNYYSM